MWQQYQDNYSSFLSLKPSQILDLRWYLWEQSCNSDPCSPNAMIKQAKLGAASVEACAPLIQHIRQWLDSIFLSLETSTLGTLPSSPGWTGCSPAQVFYTCPQPLPEVGTLLPVPHIHLCFPSFPVPSSKEKGHIDGRFGGSCLCRSTFIPSSPFTKDLTGSRILVRWLWPDQVFVSQDCDGTVPLISSEPDCC